MDYRRVLFVGPWNNQHVQRFLRILLDNKPEGLTVDYFDATCTYDSGNTFSGLDNVYVPKETHSFCLLSKVPKIRGYLYRRNIMQSFESCCRANNYDLVNIHFLPRYVDEYIAVVHKYNTRIILTPTGSDVLRLSKRYERRMLNSLQASDYITVKYDTGFYKQLLEKFSLDCNKVINVGYGSNTITEIINVKKPYTKAELAKELSIPVADYYICVGYNAYKAQRHNDILQAIAKNKQLLPANTQIIVPLTYGKDQKEIICDVDLFRREHNLPISVLVEYLSDKQNASLRLIADLFIHVQITDAYNASLQEYLLAGTECINGKWLSYPSLERDGYPYHICESIEDLPNVLAKVLLPHERLLVTESAREEIISNAWNLVIKQWIKLYETM